MLSMQGLGYNFVFWNQRTKLSDSQKALCSLLYGRGKASYRFLGKLFDVSQVSIMNYLKRFSYKLPASVIASSIRCVSFAAMWHFVSKKKRSYVSGEQWSAFEIEQLDGLLVIVLQQHSKSFTKDLLI